MAKPGLQPDLPSVPVLGAIPLGSAGISGSQQLRMVDVNRKWWLANLLIRVLFVVPTQRIISN